MDCCLCIQYRRLLIVLNIISTAASGAAETIGTIIKIGILVIFSAFGAFAIDTGEYTPVLPEGAIAIIPALGLTFIAFQGYDLISTVTEEVKKPRQNIPRAIFLALTGTIIVYLAVVIVSVGTLSAERLGAEGETAIASAAEAFMPELPLLGPGSTLIWFGAVFSTLTALNAVIIASSRVAFAMGRDRLFPQHVGRIHPKYGTPAMAVIASASIMLISVGLADSIGGELIEFLLLIGLCSSQCLGDQTQTDTPQYDPALRTAMVPDPADSRNPF